MSPTIGQPWQAGIEEFSIGDPAAIAGSDAFQGVVINPAGVDVPPSFVLSAAASPTFDLTVSLRLAAIPANVVMADPIVTGLVDAVLRFQNVDTGAISPSTTRPHPCFTSIPAPAGASGAFPGGILKWYTTTFGLMPTPAVGTYRLLLHVTAVAPFQAAMNVYYETFLTVTP